MEMLLQLLLLLSSGLLLFAAVMTRALSSIHRRPVTCIGPQCRQGDTVWAGLRGRRTHAAERHLLAHSASVLNPFFKDLEVNRLPITARNTVEITQQRASSLILCRSVAGVGSQCRHGDTMWAGLRRRRIHAAQRHLSAGAAGVLDGVHPSGTAVAQLPCATAAAGAAAR